MMDRELSGRIGKSLATLKIIWGAMLFSLAIYLFIGTYLSSRLQSGLSDPDTVDIIRSVLYAVSMATLVVTKIMRKKALAKVGEAARPEGQEDSDAVNLAPVLARYATAMIVSLALSESIGIYGLVLSLLGTGTTDLFVLTGVAAAAMVYYRPREDEVLALATGKRPGGTPYRTMQRD